MKVYTAPTIGPTLFGAVLSAAKSPVLAERPASDYYALIVSYGIDPAFLLAVMKLEHGYATNPQAVISRYRINNWGDTRTRRKATLGGKSVATDRGNFWAYLSWYDSLDDLCYRLSDQTYAYAGKRTVETIVPILCPVGDMDNDPARYVRDALATMAAWQAQEAASAAKGGKVTVQKPTVTSKPSPNRGYGGADYKPEAIVWHITAGSGASAVSWLTNPASNASANYVVLESGETVELVNPEAGANGAAWANGDVQKPDLTNPLIAGWVKAGINPNLRVCSIEHAGQSSAGKGGSLTPAQIEATVRLTAWLCQRFGIAPDQDHILGHYQINDVTRHNCPGFSAAEWSSWVGRIAALVQGGSVDQSQKIAGAVTPARPDGYMTPGQADTFTWPDGEGVITYRKVRYYNPEKRLWFEREWDANGGFTPWQQVA